MHDCCVEGLAPSLALCLCYGMFLAAEQPAAEAYHFDTVTEFCG